MCWSWVQLCFALHSVSVTHSNSGGTNPMQFFFLSGPESAWLLYCSLNPAFIALAKSWIQLFFNPMTHTLGVPHLTPRENAMNFPIWSKSVTFFSACYWFCFRCSNEDMLPIGFFGFFFLVFFLRSCGVLLHGWDQILVSLPVSTLQYSYPTISDFLVWQIVCLKVIISRNGNCSLLYLFSPCVF